jgi:hypothetical protein
LPARLQHLKGLATLAATWIVIDPVLQKFSQNDMSGGHPSLAFHSILARTQTNTDKCPPHFLGDRLQKKPPAFAGGF